MVNQAAVLEEGTVHLNFRSAYAILNIMRGISNIIAQVHKLRLQSGAAGRHIPQLTKVLNVLPF
ncbi:hypothetical protein D3C78_917240 [compost metagenome]